MKKHAILTEFDLLIADAPLDFLGTGESSRYAARQEREWHERVATLRKAIDNELALTMQARRSHLVSVPENIGRLISYCGNVWRVIGINYLGDYDIQRTEDRDGQRYTIVSNCVLGLPIDHPHYACLIETPSPKGEA